jgi:peroxiredoxin
MKANRVMALVLCGVLGAVVAKAGSLKLGDNAPQTAVKMKNVDGREISIADIAGGKGTLVIFSCNHCPFVKAWEGRIAEISNAYKDKGVGVIIINSNNPTDYAEDSFDQMQKRTEKLGLKVPYVVDATSDVARAFGATKTPEAFLFDKDGKLVYHGAVDDSKKASDVEKHFLRDALDALLAGKNVPIQETKFVGCSIKFRPKA